MAQDSDIPKKSLVEKAKVDAEAFVYLFDLHYDEIFRFHSRWLGDRAVAEEVTSRLFMTTAKYFSQFEGDLRDYRNWLYRIAAEKAVSHAKTASATEEPQHRAIEKTAILKKALAGLKPKSQIIIVLRLFENMEYSQIAHIVKLNPSVVRSRLSAAAGKLRASLVNLQLDQSAKRAITTGRDDEKSIRDYIDSIEFDDHPNRVYADRLRQKLLSEYQRYLLEPLAEPPIIFKKPFIAVAIVAVTIVMIVFVIVAVKPSEVGPAVEPVAPFADKSAGTDANDTKQKTDVLVTRFNAIMQMKNEGDIAGLFDMLKDDDAMLSSVAATMLAEIGDVDTLDMLLVLIEEQDLIDEQNPVIVAADRLKERLISQGLLKIEPDIAGLAVYGVTTDPNGQVIGATVRFGKQEPVTSDQYGEFEMIIPNTALQDSLVCFAYNMDRHIGKAFYWQKTDEQEDISIKLLPLATIIGRFVDNNDMSIPQPLPEIFIGSFDTAGKATIWKTTVYDNGRFTIEMVPTGLPIILRQPTGSGDFTMTVIKDLLPAEARNLGDIIIATEEEAVGVEETETATAAAEEETDGMEVEEEEVEDVESSRIEETEPND